jgi:energy-coupling factor transporter ATP-binding protein EcfA2
MSESSSAVTLERVSYRYPRGSDEALREIQLSVRQNEILAVMGKTGAGKTTLLSLFNGLIPHFYEGELLGDVVADGLNTRQYHVHTLASRVGFVLQDTETQILGMTVESDAAFGPCNLGLPRGRILASVHRSLAAVGLSGLERRAPAHLSGGEKQRLAVAGTLAMEPRVLVLDEPTSELDPQGRRGLFHLLRRLKTEERLAIVLSTHDSEEVVEYADRVVVLGDGKILWLGKPQDLFSEIELCREFGIRPPAAAELFWMLQQQRIVPSGPLPLTVGAAADRLVDVLRDSSPQPSPDVIPATSRRTPIIQIEDLHFRYDKDCEALNGVRLTFRQGEFTALVGTNGAGKSTLVKHLNGLLKPTSGKVLVKGLDTRTTSTSDLSRIVGYVFQNPDHQIFCPSVREEIEFGLRQGEVLPESEISGRVQRALEVVGLGNAASRHPFTLGKGERQKLAVASNLAVEPDVLIIDEPTTGLDWRGATRMMGLIRSLHEKGHTVVVITHDMQLAAEYAERIVVLSRGTVAADGTPLDVFLKPKLLSHAGLTSPPIAELSLSLRARGFQADTVNVDGMLCWLAAQAAEVRA